MSSLLQSEKFQQEYKQYQEKISKICVDDQRKFAEITLAKLVSEVKFLDSYNHELFTTHMMPVKLDESKKKLIVLRKELDKILKK
jgi:6-phosphogluconate dehydrogenase